MAIPVIVIALASAAGGAFLYDVYQKAKTKQETQDQSRQLAFQNAASQLDKGQTYAVQLMVNPKDPTWGNVTDLNRAAQIIKAVYEQLGWRFATSGAGSPQIRGNENAKRFLAGEPNEWIFTANWNRDEKYQTARPQWAGMSIPYQVPVQRLQ